jgi:hypothetical protein
MGKKKRQKRISKRKTPQTKPGNKKILILIAIGVVLVIGGFLISELYKSTSSYQKSKVQQAVDSANPSVLRGGENRPTLSPAQFTGKVARAYNVAKENRELLDSMYCYCNCKLSIGHKSLLSCYADKHAVNCAICQDQAFFALSQYQTGMDIISIRKAMDAKFWRPLS